LNPNIFCRENRTWRRPDTVEDLRVRRSLERVPRPTVHEPSPGNAVAVRGTARPKRPTGRGLRPQARTSLAGPWQGPRWAPGHCGAPKVSIPSRLVETGSGITWRRKR
jgi:hypothetical protein